MKKCVSRFASGEFLPGSHNIKWLSSKNVPEGANPLSSIEMNKQQSFAGKGKKYSPDTKITTPK